MNIFQWTKSRVSNRPDSEHNQALIRIGLVSLIYSYLEYSAHFGHLLSNEYGLEAIRYTQLYLAYSVLNIALILINPGVSIVRRIVGASADAVAITICLIIVGEIASVMFMTYLWVTLGNGFRYGRAYLFLSAILNLFGFVFVYRYSTYWSHNTYLWVGTMLGMILIPFYVSSLLKKLESSIEQAKASSNAKSRFLANMSHEMRTPLNGVIGMSDLLSMEKLTARGREIVGTIHASADALLSIINDVLDISKIEQGRLRVSPVIFDLYSLASNVVKIIEIQIDKKNVEMYLDIDTHTPYLLKGDNHLLRQVLINLLGNAAKFTPAGEIRLSIFTVDFDDEHVKIRFEVKDTGIGIPENAKEHIFDAFTQADESTTRQYGGTGLGTTISKELVSAMGGELGFASEQGSGSIFWFELPFEVVSSFDETPEENLHGKGALIFTNDDEVSACLHEHMSGWGLSMSWDSSSGELWGLLERDRIGNVGYLIVDRASIQTDLEIIAKHIGRSEGSDKIRRIAIVAKGDPTRTSDYLHAGFDVVVQKPIDKTKLFNSLHSTVTGSSESVQLLDVYRNQEATKSLRILVADDNRINRKVIDLILNGTGHNITSVADGQEALDELLGNDYDLAILDYQMPNMSGLEVTRTIRFSESPDKVLPIIVLSANATEQAKNDAMTAGATQYMTKPITAEILLSAVSSIMGTGKGVHGITSNAASNAGKQVDDSSQEYEGHIDFGLIEQLNTLGGGNEFAETIYQSFVNDAEIGIVKLGEAFECHDWVKYTDAAHALKGSALSVGGVWLADKCRLAQDIGLNSLDELGESYLADIKVGIAEVTSVLKIHLLKIGCESLTSLDNRNL